MTTTFSCVSMWMSEARRWIALKRTESTSLMIGLASPAIRSIVRTSCPSSSSLTTSSRNSSVASSRTRWVDSDFCRISCIAAREPTFTFRRFFRSASSSSRRTTSVGSVITTDIAPPSTLSGTNSKRSIHSRGTLLKRAGSTRNVQRSTNGIPRRWAASFARLSSEAASRTRGMEGTEGALFVVIVNPGCWRGS